MHNAWKHICGSCLLLLLLLSAVRKLNAQDVLQANVGDTTLLSVRELLGDTYTWELYAQVEGLNLAQTLGNCPKTKAQFVGENNEAEVRVKWLQAGEYFYKVTAQGSICSNNVKIGRLLVKNSLAPPRINVSYDCENGGAYLDVISPHKGDLLWNTGETGNRIHVAKGGEFSVTQQINGREVTTTITVAENLMPSERVPFILNRLPIIISKGEGIELEAGICEGGRLRWFRDAELQEELPNSVVYPEETTVYYVVCENEVGCMSNPGWVKVHVGKDKCTLLYEGMNVEQLLSPNGDGHNDVWNLNDLHHYCKTCGKRATVRIFNREGLKVYEKEGYMLDEERFEGYSDHSLTYAREEKLPPDIYYYTIKVDGIVGKVGFLYIVNDKK